MAYGVIQEEKPYPARFSFLIDPEGKIAKVYSTVVPAEHPDEVLADLGETCLALEGNSGSSFESCEKTRDKT